jgi:hypothetical protein
VCAEGVLAGAVALSALALVPWDAGDAVGEDKDAAALVDLTAACAALIAAGSAAREVLPWVSVSISQWSVFCDNLKEAVKKNARRTLRE